MLITSRHSLHGLLGAEGNNDTTSIYTLNSLQKLKLYPFGQQNTLFVTSAGAGTSWLTFCFSCSVIQGCSHTNCFPAQETYPQEQALVREIHSRVGEKCSCNCWADIQPVFHSSALSFGEYLRTGHVQAYKGFFFAGLKGRYEYEGGMGLKDILRQHHTPM